MATEQITQKDSDQDREIALLKQKLEDTEKGLHDLRDRVRKLERWVWGAAAVIAVGTFVIGIAANAQEETNGSNGTTEQKVLLQLQSHRN